MKKYAYGISLVAALLASAFVLTAQSDQSSPFNGTWKLNVAKSKFSPEPGPKSETVTIAPGKVSVEEVTADDKTVNWSYSPSGETPAPIEGLENATVETKESGHTVDHTWKIGSGSETGHGVVSKNGKTMKYTMTGTNAQGQPVHTVLIFEKQ